jgi:hypothetical protein
MLKEGVGEIEGSVDSVDEVTEYSFVGSVVEDEKNADKDSPCLDDASV